MDASAVTRTGVRARKSRARASSDPARFVLDYPLPAFVIDENGVCTQANTPGVELLQRSPDDVIGQSMVSWFDECTAPAVGDWLSRLSSNPDARIVANVCTGVGESRTIELSGVRTASAEFVVFLNPPLTGISLLERATRHLKSVLLILDPDLIVTYANDAVETVYGHAVQSLLGKHVCFLMQMDEETPHTSFQNALRALGERGYWCGRVKASRVNGDGFWAELCMTALLDEVGVLLGYSATVRDLSAEIEREQRASRAAKLASAGALLSGVAHEINNPLASLCNFIHLMLANPSRGGDDRQILTLMQRETDRLGRIVADLRTMVRNDEDMRVERGPVDLNEIVRYTLQTQSYRLRTLNISVETNLGSIPPVFADRTQIEQVLLNLVVNAEQAMDGQQGERKICITTMPSLRGGRVFVDDTGPGVPERLRERIFDPFFTSKGSGDGIGLGLSLVQQIVAAHSGDVQVTDAPGGGARFIVDLPRARLGDSQNDAPNDVVVQTSCLPLRILLVDDEEILRSSVHAILRLDGHYVDEAADARQAIQRIDEALSRGRGYDVVVSDLRMAGLGGEYLLTTLRERGDDLANRVIFITGDTASSGATRLLAGVPVIYKPFKPEQILAAVRMLGDRQAN